jgi:hypothetical protein
MFIQTNLNDIALIKLEKPATLAYNVWPACLSTNTKGSIKDLIIIGFGRISNADTKLTSEWLLKASVEETELTACQKKFKTIPGSKPIEKSQVCAVSPKTFSDTCQVRTYYCKFLSFF